MAIAEQIFILSDGREIPVYIESKWGLRNITLRPRVLPRPEIRISMPRLTSAAAAMRFLESKRRWAEKIFARAPEKAKLSDGDVITFLGHDVQIHHSPHEKRNFYLIPQTSNLKPQTSPLIIGGNLNMLERRVRDFIKDEFLRELKAIIKTTPREFHPKRIRITDTTSRWGSCSSTGTMSFSYRLAFAPLEIMRYVIMHELAHTKYMDHSPAFWATVAELYGPGVGRAKLWLSKNGTTLHKYF